MAVSRGCLTSRVAVQRFLNAPAEVLLPAANLAVAHLNFLVVFQTIPPSVLALRSEDALRPPQSLTVTAGDIRMAEVHQTAVQRTATNEVRMTKICKVSL